MARKRTSDELNLTGIEILSWRKEAGMSRDKLSEISGVSRSTLFNLEKGIDQATNETMIKVAGVRSARPSFTALRETPRRI